MPQNIRPGLWRTWHNLLNWLDADFSNVFLNYGYASPNGEFDDLHLQEGDEPNRYGIQLYRHATRGAVLENANMLEVGSGRGGGASFLTRYGRPKEYVALDVSEKLIAKCQRFHQVPGLRFVCGSAMHLPFVAGRFDAVVNVESARCYGDIGAFFRETHRVLRPGGHFFFADMMKNEDAGKIQNHLQAAGFGIVQEKDIRENVVLALQLDASARKKTIDERVPKLLRQSFYEFAGVEGSNRFRAFADDKMQYKSFILQKKGT